MELTYQSNIQLPTQYCVLSEEEMTYLVGGDYSFSVGKYTVTFHPEVLGQYALNFCVNAAYVIGMAATSAAITGIVKGYQDGLSFGQTVDHFWGRQNTGGRIAAVAVGAFAGYYIYVEAIQIYNTVVSLVDSVKTWWADSHAQAAVAA